MKRKTKRITESIFFGILLLILGLIYWLLYTTSGLNWSLKTVNRAIGTILDYGVVEGAWLTQMQFDYLTVRTPAMDIQGDNFKLKISVKNLMSGTLDIVAAQTTSLVLK
ncbi:MAG: hypothetical protein PVF82_08820, partial [Gammaproteobacteria bacterium]